MEICIDLYKRGHLPNMSDLSTGDCPSLTFLRASLLQEPVGGGEKKSIRQIKIGKIDVSTSCSCYISATTLHGKD